MHACIIDVREIYRNSYIGHKKAIKEFPSKLNLRDIEE